MATLTIRNLPDDVRDHLRRAAAERGRSMEEEARQALAERYRSQLTAEEIIQRLSRIERDGKKARRSGMAASEVLVAGRRLESLVESGLISRQEKASWDRQIDDGRISFADVERFAAKKRNWPSKKP